jgi:hypothetical protein
MVKRQSSSTDTEACPQTLAAVSNMAKSVAIIQSCYVPWKGYFDIINSVDEFILYDDCQYTRQDWRNRNRVKTPRGTRWLTIPVRVQSLYTQRLDETEVADSKWAASHWEILRQSYAKAPGFRLVGDEIRGAYESVRFERRLSRINRALVEAVCGILDIRTSLSWSTDHDVSGSGSDRVLDLCQSAGAKIYLSGPRAQAYLDEAAFEIAGIELKYFEYDGYPEYPQLYPPFDHNVSIIDLLFNTGADARSLMKSFDVGGRAGRDT